MEEAEIHQVHDGVFDAADILIDRQPVVGSGWIQHPLVVLRAGIARVVPGRLHKGVEGVGFAQRRLAVNGGFRPLRIGFDRAGNAVHHHIFRQDHRQLVFWRWHHGTVFQRDHRDWCAPITLAGNAPVAQTVVNLALTNAFGDQFVGNGVETVLVIQTVKLAGVEQRAFLGHRFSLYIRLAAVEGQNDRFDWQAVFGGEFPVALIVSRNRHHRAGTVFHQHKVGDPNWHLLAGQRMDGEQAGRHALFLHRRHFGFGHFGVTALFDKFSQRRVVHRALLRQWVTCGYGHVGRAHKGVRTGGVNRQLFVAARYVKGDIHPFGTANPVALHGFHLFWPAFKRVQIVEQLIGVVGDFDKPLWDLFTLNLGVAAPAAAVDHLFVGQHGQIVWAPVHRGSLLVDQAFFVQLGEEPLFPTVVIRIAGGDLAIPVIAEAQQFQLVLHVFDIVVGPRSRCGVVFNRSAFRRQAERIPANRL
ncbi:hypothetical protein D3C81_337250 [compost metagenome]